MFKVLIVDDDQIIRQGIARNIDWEAHDFQVVAKAGNGLEGLELVKDYQPQIVISDIRMPLLDGLEMTGRINDLYPRTKVILLTAYEDFEYAKQGIRLKVSDYILKYADNQEILQAALKARQELMEESILREGGLLVRNKFLNDLLVGKVDPERVTQEGEFLNISFTGRHFCLAVIVFDGMEKPSLAPEEDLHQLVAICNQTLSDYDGVLAFLNAEHQVCLMFGMGDNSGEVNQFIADVLEAIKEKVESCFQSKFSMGVGNVYEGYLNIPESYREALQALKMRDVLNKRGIIHIDSVRYNENSQMAIFKQIVAFVEKNYYRENLTLSLIAKEVHIAHTYICTLFKKVMHESLGEYLIRLRIEKAKELIVHTDLKTYQVAEKVGYTNPQYFSVLFKKSTGYTPTEFRNCHPVPGGKVSPNE